MDRERRETEEIEFDFFDDAPTREATARDVEPPSRRRRLPTGGPGGPAGTPLVRLAALIAGLILLAVVLVLWVQSCREDQRKAQYENYMEEVASVGAESEQIGKKLNQVLSTPGKRVEDLRQDIDGLRRQESQLVTRARELDPPGPLREQHESLIDALELRVSGLNGLAQAFGQIGDRGNARAAGQQLAVQTHRLLASDVVYADFFMGGAETVLEREDITGVAVPKSTFVRNSEFASPAAWTPVVRRLTGAGTAGGLHGNQIVGVVVQPGGKRLVPGGDNTVKGSDRLAFDVLVKNSGENQEVQVKVNLTVQQSPEPIRKSAVIDIINPGETKTVTFTDPGQLSYGARTTVKVTVEPVVGETNRNNNTAEYPVIFTL